MTPYRSILVPVINSDISRSSLSLAFSAARKFGSHLDVLHVKPDPRHMIPYVGEGMSGALIEEVMDAAEKEAGDRAISVHELFQNMLREIGVAEVSEPQTGMSAQWHEAAGREDEAIAGFGRLADLIVVNRPRVDAEVPTSAAFESALFETGQALLVAPPQPKEDFGANILIAWNGSPEAARAVTSALPVLELADKITAITASGWADGPASIEGLARRLRWRGLSVDVHSISSPNGTIGETVLQEAASVGADLVVMGAYTQSRLRQMILGGVTRHVLATAEIPLLMAH